MCGAIAPLCHAFMVCTGTYLLAFVPVPAVTRMQMYSLSYMPVTDVLKAKSSYIPQIKYAVFNIFTLCVLCFHLRCAL